MIRRKILIGAGLLGLAGAGSYSEMRRMGSMEEFTVSVAATRAALATRPEMRDLIRYATLAPSGHNTQPWRFQVGESQINILPDFARRTPIVDPDDHHIFVSLGAATENLVLACAAHGRSGEYKEFLAMKQAETPVKTYRMDAPRGLRVVRLNRLNSVRTLIRNYALEQEFMKHRIRRIVGN